MATLDQELGKAFEEVSRVISKSAPDIANNMGAQIAGKASSGKTKYTKAVSAREIRRDLNKLTGKTWGKRRKLRVKHIKAIQLLKNRGQPFTWEDVKTVADRIIKSSVASRAFSESWLVMACCQTEIIHKRI